MQQKIKFRGWDFSGMALNMARLERFELPTLGTGIRIFLSIIFSKILIHCDSKKNMTHLKTEFGALLV